MTRFGILSDTHGRLDPAVLKHFEKVDQILHAGDIGSEEVLSALEKIAPVTAIGETMISAHRSNASPMWIGSSSTEEKSF